MISNELESVEKQTSTMTTKQKGLCVACFAHG